MRFFRVGVRVRVSIWVMARVAIGVSEVLDKAMPFGRVTEAYARLVEAGRSSTAAKDMRALG